MLPVHDTPRAFVRDLRTQSLDLIDLHPVDMLEDVLSPLRLDERGDEWPSWHEVGREPSEDDGFEEDDEAEGEGDEGEEGGDEDGSASASGSSERSEPKPEDDTYESEDGSEERWLFE